MEKEKEYALLKELETGQIKWRQCGGTLGKQNINENNTRNNNEHLSSASSRDEPESSNHGNLQTMNNGLKLNNEYWGLVAHTTIRPTAQF